MQNEYWVAINYCLPNHRFSFSTCTSVLTLNYPCTKSSYLVQFQIHHNSHFWIASEIYYWFNQSHNTDSDNTMQMFWSSYIWKLRISKLVNYYIWIELEFKNIFGGYTIDGQSAILHSTTIIDHDLWWMVPLHFRSICCK